MRWRLRAAIGVLAVVAAVAGPSAFGLRQPFAPIPPAAAAAQSDETLEAVARFVAALPQEGDVIPLAGTATEVGHWRLVNKAGEPFTAASRTELDKAWQVVAPKAAGTLDRVTIYLTPESVFRYRAAIRELPAELSLRVLIDGQSYGLRRIGEGEAQGLTIDLPSGLAVKATTRAQYDEIAWQLRRRLVRERIRILALEPGGPTVLPRAPEIDPDSRSARPDAIDPEHVLVALRALGGQTALIAGRLDRGRLFYKSAGGTEGAVLVAELAAAAAASDVNLIVLGTDSPRQPGTRNMLWLRVGLPNMGKAAGNGSLGETLRTLAGEPARLVASPAGENRQSVELALRPERSASRGSIGVITDAVAGTLSGLMPETTGALSIESIEARLISSSRQAELDRRIVPGVPSLVQYGLAALFLAGMPAFPTLARWWRRLWPIEIAQDYASRSGHVLARLIRGLAFGLIFVPLAALPALLVRCAQAVGLLRESPVKPTG
ncbi:MAG: hypothetical protein JSS20_00725 [Proteobacteria bacterium]|nr:hypothetical protein [Pseudomonadota bacterium]